MVMVEASHRVMDSRSKVREMINTVSAPMRAAKYEIMAPVHGPKVYPERMMRVEYSGIGGNVVRKIKKKRTACPNCSSLRSQWANWSRPEKTSALYKAIAATKARDVKP